MTAFRFERPDGTQRTLSGYQRTDPTRWGGKKLGASRLAASRLPPQVDLRDKMTAVENQAGTNSCVATRSRAPTNTWSSSTVVTTRTT